MTNACKYELGKTCCAQYVIHMYTTYECSNESSIVWIGKSTKLQSNLAKNFGNIAISSFKHSDLVRKWGKLLWISEKVGFTFSTVQYIIKHFLAAKSLGNDRHSSLRKKLNPTQNKSLIINSQKNPFKSAPSLTIDLTLSMGVTVHPQTVRNVLYSAGIHGRYLWKNITSPKRIVSNAWQLQKSMYTSLLAFGRPLYFPINQNTTYADLMDKAVWYMFAFVIVDVSMQLQYVV